jgi:DNA-binding NtrC family response regulator
MKNNTSKNISQDNTTCYQNTSILVVGADTKITDQISSILAADYNLEKVSDSTAALEIVCDQTFDCVLIDTCFIGQDRLSLIGEFKKANGNCQVIVLCSASEIASAVTAIRAGASDFIIKEVELNSLPDRIAKLFGQTIVDKTTSCDSINPDEKHMVIGKSRRMLEIIKIARRAAATPVSVLILGESGTGKELMARWIHQMSSQAKEPFVAVNLAAIPADLIESTLFGHEKGAYTGATGQRSGKFGQAQNGTLLLDEISELKLELQPKLLRALQENEYTRVGGEKTIKSNARIIAATNQNLANAVKQGSFRSDLYYRLNVITLTLPPLRERIEDIPELVDLFIAKYNRLYGYSVKGLHQNVIKTLMNHDWPGNIRELENAVQRAVVVADSEYLSVSDLFAEDVLEEGNMIDKMAEQDGTLEDLEQEYIEAILERTNGHQGQSAKILGIDRKTLYNKIMKYGLGQSLNRKTCGA